MGKQVTEMLKGTLEGIVLAILSGRPAYGYEITAWLREQGFSDIAEGTVYALLDQDRAARPRRRGEGPLREGAAAQGVLPQRPGTGIPRRVLEDLELPHGTTRTAPRRRQIDMAAKWIEKVTGRSSRRGTTGSTRRARNSFPRATARRSTRCSGTSMYFGRRRRQTAWLSMLEDLADLFEQSAANGTPIREIVGDDPVEFAEAFLAELPGGSVDRPGAEPADQRHRARRRGTKSTGNEGASR